MEYRAPWISIGQLASPVTKDVTQHWRTFFFTSHKRSQNTWSGMVLYFSVSRWLDWVYFRPLAPVLQRCKIYHPSKCLSLASGASDNSSFLPRSGVLCPGCQNPTYHVLPAKQCQESNHKGVWFGYNNYTSNFIRFIWKLSQEKVRLLRLIFNCNSVLRPVLSLKWGMLILKIGQGHCTEEQIIQGIRCYLFEIFCTITCLRVYTHANLFTFLKERARCCRSWQQIVTKWPL